MKVEVIKSVEIKLTLTYSEAVNLQTLLQNPLSDEIEADEEHNVRREVFTALKDAIDKA